MPKIVYNPLESSFDYLNKSTDFKGDFRPSSGVWHYVSSQIFSGGAYYTKLNAPTTDRQLANKKYVDDAVIAGGGYTDEQAQDAVGNIFKVGLTYDDAGNQIYVTDYIASASAVSRFADSSNIRLRFPGSSNINRTLLNTISSNLDNRIDSLFNWSSNKGIYYPSGIGAGLSGSYSAHRQDLTIHFTKTSLDDDYQGSSQAISKFTDSSNVRFRFIESGGTKWVDLTDGGETSLHTHAGMTTDVAWSGAYQFYVVSSLNLTRYNQYVGFSGNKGIYYPSALGSRTSGSVSKLWAWSANKSWYANSSNVRFRFVASSISLERYNQYIGHSSNADIHYPSSQLLGWLNALYQESGTSSTSDVAWSGAYQFYSVSSTTDTRLDSIFNYSSNAKNLYADSGNVRFRFVASSISLSRYNEYIGFSSNKGLYYPSSLGKSLYNFSGNAKNLFADSGNIRFRFVESGGTKWIDLTDGGETTLHTHAGMTTDVAWSGAYQFYAVSSLNQSQYNQYIGFSSNKGIYFPSSLGRSLINFSSNADELFLWSGVSEINELSDVDTQTTSPSRDQVLKWNGSNWVPAAYNATFEFTIASFSDGETTTQLIGTGIFQAQDSMSFTATYNNGPPDASLVFVGYNSTNYYKSGVVGEMTSPNYTAGTNSSLDVSYPAAKDQYLRFLLSSNSGTDKDTYAETAIYFRNYVYYGVLSKSDTFSEADIESLTSALTNSYTTSRTINAGAGEHLIIAYPESYTTIHANGFKFNSITCPFSSAASVSITNSAGYTENYRVHPSKLPGLGNSTLSLSTSATIINYLYYGITLKTDTFTEADIENLANSEVTNDNTQTWDSVTAGVGEYLLFAFPTRLGIVTFYVGGFEGGFEDPETVSVTNVNGYSEDYYVWRSTNSNLGATVVVTS